MPFKNGPHGTKRFYSKSTGRYCKYNNTLTNDNKTKMPFYEKEKIRRESLYNRARNSKDKNLFEVYQMLDNINPGCVTHINDTIYDKIHQKNREFDIITTKAIYEIKSGSSKRKYKQFFAQMEYAKYVHKDYVVYTPGSSNYQIKCMRRAGINAFNNFNEFYESEKRRKC